MALRDIKNETPKEFAKKTVKVYMKEVLKGVAVAAVLIAVIVLYHACGSDDGQKSGFGEFVEGVEDTFKGFIGIEGIAPAAGQLPADKN